MKLSAVERQWFCMVGARAGPGRCAESQGRKQFGNSLETTEQLTVDQNRQAFIIISYFMG